MICESCHRRVAGYLVTFDNDDLFSCCWVCAGAAMSYGVVTALPEPETTGGDAA